MLSPEEAAQVDEDIQEEIQELKTASNGLEIN